MPAAAAVGPAPAIGISLTIGLTNAPNMLHNSAPHEFKLPLTATPATLRALTQTPHESPSEVVARFAGIHNKPNLIRYLLDFPVLGMFVSASFRRFATSFQLGQQHSGQVFALGVTEQHRMVRAGAKVSDQS